MLGGWWSRHVAGAKYGGTDQVIGAKLPGAIVHTYNTNGVYGAVAEPTTRTGTSSLAMGSLTWW